MNLMKIFQELLVVTSGRTNRFFNRPLNPRLITLNITDRCNSKCKMCDIHNRVPAGAEMTLSEIEKLFRSRTLANLDVVRITGGEPFLRNDVAEIFRIIQNNTKPEIICVTTNGSFPERVKEFAGKVLPSDSLLHFHVSMDTLDKRNDAIRGMKGSLSKSLETIEILCEFRKKHRFHLGINQTILKENLDQIVPMSEFAMKHGIGHNIILGAKYHESSNIQEVLQAGQPLGFSTFESIGRDSMEQFYRDAFETKRKPHFQKVRDENFSALLRDISEVYLFEGGKARVLRDVNYPSPACMAMFTHLRILPHGNVIACSALSAHPVGNIHEKPFDQIWKSKEACEIRNNIRNCPGCWIECDIGPSIFHSGDIIKWMLLKFFQDSQFRRAYLSKIVSK